MIRLETKRRQGTRTLAGLDYYGLLAETPRENCDARDSACVMRNEQVTDAVRAVWSQYMASPDGAPAGTVVSVQTDNSPAALAQFMNNQVVTSQRVTVDTPTAAPVTYTTAQLNAGATLPDNAALLPPGVRITAPAPVAVASATTYTPRLQFANTSGASGTQLTSGDYWRVSITGGAPNSPVTVRGGKNGATSTSAAGSTDGAGAFSLTGQVTDAEIGAWAETWNVGPTAAGSVSFAVSPRPAPIPAAGATVAILDANQTGITPTPATSSPAILATITDTLSRQPWYILAGGAAAALFVVHSMMSTGGRR